MKQIFIGAAISACLLSACQPGTGASTTGSSANAESNKQKALNVEIAFGNKDVAGVMKDYAADFTDYGSLEWAPMNNLDTIKAGLESFMAAFPDLKGHNLCVCSSASGDTVVILGQWSGTFSQSYMGMQPTNKSFKYNDADIFAFNKDGKIISHRSVQGEATIMMQLGIIPPTAEKK
jgi:predicted ester cyclase